MSAAEKIVSLDVVRQARAQEKGRPRMQDGFVAIPNQVEDALLLAPITHRQERVFRAILRKTIGYGKETDCIANSQISAMTGIDEAHVRKAIVFLEDAGMLSSGKRTQSGTFRTPNLAADQWKPERANSAQIGARTGQKSPNKRADSAPHNRQLQTIVEPNGSRHSADANDAPETGKQRRQVKGSAQTSDKLVELFHHLCPSLPRISILSPARRQAMKARWIQAGKEIGMYDINNLDAGLDWWQMFFRVVETSDFLSGRSAPSPGREKPFRANLDWLLKQANFAKVIEGHYDNEVAK